MTHLVSERQPGKYARWIMASPILYLPKWPSSACNSSTYFRRRLPGNTTCKCLVEPWGWWKRRYNTSSRNNKDSHCAINTLASSGNSRRSVTVCGARFYRTLSQHWCCHPQLAPSGFLLSRLNVHHHHSMQLFQLSVASWHHYHTP